MSVSSWLRKKSDQIGNRALERKREARRNAVIANGGTYLECSCGRYTWWIHEKYNASYGWQLTPVTRCPDCVRRGVR